MAVLLTEVKTYLWITSNADDTKLTAILDGLNEDILSRIWDITLWEKTQTIKNSRRLLRDKYSYWSSIRNITLQLNIINPTQILTINWNDFSTKVLWTDYVIDTDWIAHILNLTLLTRNNFGFFDITYTAWYATTPKQLIALTSEYIGYLYSKDLWKDIIEEKLWPRGVKYASNDKLKDNFYKWLNNFIPLWLRIW